MKDAFGATYYIKFAIVFVGLFVVMLAIALNYAKAFRLKNAIISYIEANNGLSEVLKEDIENYAASVNYYVSSYNTGEVSYDTSLQYFDKFNNACTKRGYCIYRLYNDVNRGAYYRVITFVHVEFPLFGFIVDIPVTGETKIVTERYVKK